MDVRGRGGKSMALEKRIGGSQQRTKSGKTIGGITAIAIRMN